MALTVISPLVVREDADSGTWTGTGAPAIDSDFKFSGSGSIAVDTDIETNAFYSPAFASVDLTGDRLFAAMLCMTQPNLDTKANGGMRLGVRDSAGNISYWYVGGLDSYSGGWEDFGCDLGSTPDANNGTNANITDITNVAIGWKCLAKSKLSKNCFGDLFRTGAIGLIITGANATTDEGWSEVEALAAALPTGLIKKLKTGLYVLKAPVQIGDDAGALTTNFSDKATNLIWDDLPVGDDYYALTVSGNATGTTDVRLGSVVGTGDGRQGVQGGGISTAGPSWSWDSQADIADIDSVSIYGANWSGAKRKIEFDDGAKTTVISFAAVNCGRINPGDTNGGAEILSVTIIDPDDDVDAENRGLRFPATHNIKRVSFITSGVPATQHMAHLDALGDYSVLFDAIKYFGDFSSGTLWHGENSANNANTVTVNTANSANPLEAEFENTGIPTPTTTVVSGLITLSVTVLDKSTDLPIQDANVFLHKKGFPETVYINKTTNASGVASEQISYDSDTDLAGWARQMDIIATDYSPEDIAGRYDSNGFAITIKLEPLT